MYHDVYSSMFKNLNYIDSCLESVGVTVAYMKVKIACFIYAFITIGTHVYIRYIQNSVVFALQHKHKVLAEIPTIYDLLIRNSLHMFTVFLSLQYLYVLLRVYYSVHCVRNAAEGIERIKVAREAWTSNFNYLHYLHRSNMLEHNLTRFK